MIGFFLNTLALRADLSGNPRVGELVASVRGTLLTAYQHQDLPFEKLVAELQPERDLSRTPIFQVMFVLLHVSREEPSRWGLRGSPLAVESGAAKFDLTFYLSWRGGDPSAGAGELAGSIEYDRDLFDRATIERLGWHWRTLLAGMVAEPESEISALPLLTSVERHQLLVEWNATGASYPAFLSLHGAIEMQVARSPLAVAVSYEGSTLSYEDLNARANLLARELLGLGVGPEIPVAIAAERSLALLVGLLAILKAGGAYVPLDLSYPADRLAFLLEELRAAGGSVLLTEESAVAALPESAGLRRILLDRLPFHAERAASLGGAGNLAERSGGDHLAYVLYTSGSTGRPKGVMNSHAGILNRLLWFQDRHGLSAADRVLQKTPLSFDVSVWELFWPLMTGAELVLARPGGHRDGAYLAELIEVRSITVTHFVPSMLEAFLREPDLSGCGSLRAVMASGEALSPALGRRFAERLGAQGVELHNLYGPTEAAVDVTAHRFESVGDSAEPRWMPIGRPVSNTRIHLLDRDLRPVPVVVPGELVIGGVQLARGYLGRPDLTAGAFVPDPLGTEPGARLYRTGDLARFLPGGEIVFLGRLDHQVKLRGIRIELGEIESMLRSHSSVSETAVLLRSDGPRGPELVAYVVPAVTVAMPDAVALTPPEINADELRRFLAAKLPEPMVPSAWVTLSALPVTPNGKLDRAALPAPAVSAISAGTAGTGDEAPRTVHEELLAGIWSVLLGLPAVGIHDSFFALGGHSLLGMQLVSRVREAFQVELPLRVLFEMPTIAALAAHLGRAEAGAAPVPPIVRRASGGAARLSFEQERLWFLARFQPESAEYNIPSASRLHGDLDVAALAAALRHLEARHESLRTSFAEVDGEPVQTIAPPRATDPLVLVDLGGVLSGLGPGADAEALLLAHREAARPFDLLRGPFYRVVLLRLSAIEHVLLLTVHHIISDAWSGEIWWRELAALYTAIRAGRPSALAPLAVGYADYAAWQRERLSGEELARQRAWWRQHLAGAPHALELPADRPRPKVRRSRGGSWQGAAVDPSVVQGVTALARRSNATSFMTLLAAFDVLLHRYTGQSDLVVGTPIANRGRRETEGVIGFFLNTLALRADLSGNPRVSELVAGVRGTLLAAYQHRDLPFEKLVAELQPERDLSRTPIFQVMFVLLETAASSEMPGMVSEPLYVSADTTQFDLTFALERRSEERRTVEVGLAGSIEYDRDLFDRATIERLGWHWRTLLAGMVAEPESEISALPLLTSVERHQLLVEWNATGASYPAFLSLHGAIEMQVARSPLAVAVSYEGSTLSYEDLNARANLLARELLGLGVGPEIPVAIAAERSLALLVGLLAILKAGGAYVPLDLSYPADRLAFLLEELRAAGGSVLLTEESAVAALPESAGLRRILLDRLPFHAERAASLGGAGNLAERSGGDHLAYVLYTSGSTGRPKGVMNSHAGILNRLLWFQDRHGLSAADRVLQKTPLSFDVSVWELFWPLMTGAELVLARPGGHRDGAYLAELIEVRSITVTHFVPSMLEAFLREPDLSGCGSLRAVMASGEALSPALGRRFAERLGAQGVELHNLYGPTEAAVDVTAHRFESVGDSAEPRWMPIGRPVSNTRIHLLDRDLRPVPVVVPGELVIGGVQLARGYLGRPDLTAGAFVPDPLGTEPGARLYRTGDLARFLPGGEIVFLGRLDHQVKLRGIRIELGEIESMLRSHSSVSETAVLLRSDGPRGPELVAYVVPAVTVAMPDAVALTPPEINADELRRFLAAKLPEPMVPSAWVTLSALPVTPNGKLDRAALPAPAVSAISAGTAGTGDEAPRTVHEELLAGIWSVLLGLPAVGIHDSFFALGGHSLLGMQLVSRVREAFQVELPLRVLFEMPTIAALAAHLGRAEAGATPVPPIVRRASGGAARLSFEQERLWFLARFQPESAEYNIPSASRLHGDLDVAALAAALRHLEARHESLRTSFAEVDGEPVQTIAPPRATDPLVLVDLGGVLSGLGPGADAEALLLARREAARPFDLLRGPFYRVVLLRLSAIEHVLLLTVHHIISDAWSGEIWWRELAALYTAIRAGRPSALAPLAVGYADYAAWQRERLSGEELARQRAWWRQHLAGAPHALELPADRPRPKVRRSRGGSWQGAAVDPSVVQGVTALARRSNATSFMTLLAAFDVLLHRYTGQSDLVVGTPIANRGRRETEGVIGFFLNTLALRADLSGNPRVSELVAGVRGTLLAAYQHRDLPFEKLVAELQPERDLSRTPIFQVMFVLLHVSREEPSRWGLRGSPLAVESGAAKFDLTFYLSWRGGDPSAGAGELAGSIEYDRDLFDRATIERLGWHWRTLLAGIVAEPESEISALPLLTSVERHQLLVEWNATGASYPAFLSLHGAIEMQVARSPLAVAVSYEGSTLSYEDLNARANLLARELLGLGVGPEIPVAIAAERSLALLVGLLAILKAGGAYVPLDLSYPADRLAFLLEELRAAGGSVLLTEESAVAALPESAGLRRILLDRLPFHAERAASLGGAGNLAERSGGDHLAYVLYTSGSTGRPKGVMNSHAGILNRLLWFQDRHGLSAADRVLQKTPLSFDVSVWELFWPLMTGAELVLARPGGHRDGAYLAELIEVRSITVTHFVPSMLEAFLREPDLSGCGSLRAVMASGEALSPALGRRFAERLGAQGVELHNLYGPTEAAVDVTAHRFESVGDSAEPRWMPIGRPVSNTRIHLLDRDLRPVPVVVPGELVIGGVQLARGYLGRPDLTAGAFVPDPLGTEPGARLYRTGDLARFLPGGEIVFLGRLDHQVKLRGIRIELGEIESMLRSHSSVSETAVLLRSDGPRGPELVAYVVPAVTVAMPDAVALTPPEINADELRRFLAAKLPEPMVPSSWVALSALPVTSNGKLDRAALPVPASTRAASEMSYLGPRDELELRLAAIWEEILGVGPIGMRDDFFTLGGHSLLAMRLAASIRASLGQELPLASLFIASTVEGLAALLRRQAQPARQSLVEIARGDGERAPLFFVHPVGGEAHLLRRSRPCSRSGSGHLGAAGAGPRRRPLTFRPRRGHGSQLSQCGPLGAVSRTLPTGRMVHRRRPGLRDGAASRRPRRAGGAGGADRLPSAGCGALLSRRADPHQRVRGRPLGDLRPGYGGRSGGDPWARGNRPPVAVPLRAGAARRPAAARDDPRADAPLVRGFRRKPAAGRGLPA